MANYLAYWIVKLTARCPNINHKQKNMAPIVTPANCHTDISFRPTSINTNRFNVNCPSIVSKLRLMESQRCNWFRVRVGLESRATVAVLLQYWQTNRNDTGRNRKRREHDKMASTWICKEHEQAHHWQILFFPQMFLLPSLPINIPKWTVRNPRRNL